MEEKKWGLIVLILFILLISSLLKENKHSHNLLFIFDYFTHFTVVNFKIEYKKLYQVL